MHPRALQTRMHTERILCGRIFGCSASCSWRKNLQCLVFLYGCGSFWIGERFVVAVPAALFAHEVAGKRHA